MLCILNKYLGWINVNFCLFYFILSNMVIKHFFYFCLNKTVALSKRYALCQTEDMYFDMNSSDDRRASCPIKINKSEPNQVCDESETILVVLLATCEIKIKMNMRFYTVMSVG